MWADLDLLMARYVDSKLRRRRKARLFGGRDSVPCLWCLRPVRPEEATLEHVTPWVMGGGHSIENSDIACRECNQTRGHSQWVPARALLMPPVDYRPSPETLLRFRTLPPTSRFATG